VLGLSLGQSAVYAILRLADRLTAAAPLAQQTAAMNTSDSPKPWLDLLYQLAGFGFGLLPAVLALFFLAGWAPPTSAAPDQPRRQAPCAGVGPPATGATDQPRRQAPCAGVGPLACGATDAQAADADCPASAQPSPPATASVTPGAGLVPAAARWAGPRRVGLTLGRPLRDLGWGAVLASGIGLPGLAFYLVGRQLGVTVHIETQALGQFWWTVPVLVLAAVKNGLVEEVIAVGYLAERLTALGWRPWAWMAGSALLRGSYHLYQGFGPFIGNVAMGLVFAWFYHRRGRVMPLVAAHSLIDLVAFIGPSLVNPAWLT
jgi:membrane protease YdiL (CAAX protease family)